MSKMEENNKNPEYKYHLNLDIPFSNRYEYKIVQYNDFNLIKELQTKYKLKYIFTDNTWTIMVIHTKCCWIEGLGLQ